VLDLPEGLTTCLFDLDGVLTQTATLREHGADVGVEDLAELLEKRS
jgi:beta-phosphoglucomutase-like phosphatase (HAD superfamily)